MSPSTKNLKERIEEIIDRICVDDDCYLCVRKKHIGIHSGLPEELLSLLSSELSLAIKGLRKKIAGGKKTITLAPLKSVRDGGIRQVALEHWDDGFNKGIDHTLSVFDTKAKEILGESS